MDGARFRYPCKPYPYKRFPFGFQYPCRKGSSELEVKEIFKAKEPEVVEVEEETESVMTTGVRYPPLKRQCSFPYYRSCRESCRHRYKTTSKWQRTILNEWERGKEDIVCITPAMKDSYDILCSIPLCVPKPPETIKLRKPFNPVHCVFCNQSLYAGGTIYDLERTVPAIIRQSNDQDDDIAYRIGLRTRIVVHKSCFDEYVRRGVTYLLDYDPNACDSNESSV